MARARLWITVLALPVGLFVADLGVGRWLAGRADRELALPPFGALPEELRADFEGFREAARRGKEVAKVGGFDVELGWTNTPGTAPGGEIRINSIGARGAREYEALPPSGVTRAIAYGPSFVFGSEVGDEACWPRRMELLDAGVEVLNFGVGGYGSDQALLRFRREGLHGAGVALFGLCLEDIGRNVNRYRPIYVPGSGPGHAKPRFVLDANGELMLVPLPYADRVELLTAVLGDTIRADLAEHEYWREPLGVWSWSTTARVLAAHRAFERRERRYALWLEPDREPYRVSLAIVQTFVAEARAAGAERVLVVLFGLTSDVQSLRSAGRKYWQGLLDELAASGIECVDMNDEIVALGMPLAFLNEHYDARGNDAVARRLLDELRP